jgi:hypothetical protein
LGGWGLYKKDLNEISPSGEPRTAAKKGEKIKEGGVKNKITINPTVQVEAKVDQGKDRASKINTRNQRTFGNRRGEKGGMHSVDDTEARRYNTAKGRGVKMKGKKDKTAVNYHEQDRKKRVDALLKGMTAKGGRGVKMKSMKEGVGITTDGTSAMEKAKKEAMLKKKEQDAVNKKMKKESLLDQVANAYVDEATRMKKEMGYDKGGTKKPTGPKAKDAALDAIKAKYKGQIMRTGSKQEKKVKGAKPSGGGKFKMMAIKKKETETAAKKAGYKNTQDYVNVQAVRKGGLGT